MIRPRRSIRGLGRFFCAVGGFRGVLWKSARGLYNPVMGFDLTNDCGTYLRFSPSGWALALTIGERYGWKPEGTTLTESEAGTKGVHWSGEYATNDGQRASAADARSLADACERALSDPAYEARTTDTLNGIYEAIAQQSPCGRGDTPDRAIDPDVAKKFRVRLQELIAFCGEGSFIIE